MSPDNTNSFLPCLLLSPGYGLLLYVQDACAILAISATFQTGKWKKGREQEQFFPITEPQRNSTAHYCLCLIQFSPVQSVWIQFSSVQSEFSSVQSLSDSLWPHGLQHTRPPCPSPTPKVYSNSCPLSQWHHPTISSSLVPFSSCPQSFPASGSFLMSQLFTSGDQRIGVSASASVLPMNIQDSWTSWSPLGWSGLILLSKGLSRVFSNITVQKHQFFGAQLSL